MSLRASIGLFATLLLTSSCSILPGSGGSTLDKEADNAARQYWETGLTECSDSFYGKHSFTSFILRPTRRNYLYQFKDVEFEVKGKPLTEADKLNNVEWRGAASFSYKAWRYYDLDQKEWNKWISGKPIMEAPPNVVAIRKQNARWIIGGEDSKHPYSKIDCTDIPK